MINICAAHNFRKELSELHLLPSHASIVLFLPFFLLLVDYEVIAWTVGSCGKSSLRLMST